MAAMIFIFPEQTWQVSTSILKTRLSRRAQEMRDLPGGFELAGDLPGLNRSSSCDKIWAKKGPDHGKKEIHT